MSSAAPPGFATPTAAPHGWLTNGPNATGRRRWHSEPRNPSFSPALIASAGCAASLLGTRHHQLSQTNEHHNDLSAAEETTAEAVLAQACPRCRRFVAGLLVRGINVVVFDMDQTMGSGHCGKGLPRSSLQEYVGKASPDFVEAIRVLCRLPGVQLAVATMSDPAEYDLPGQSRETHILGPDLARALIEHWCPEAVSRFEVMVGFDHKLHSDVPEELGKSVHMRRIAAHYGTPFKQMVLIDDSPKCLENLDGWHGVLVTDTGVGFRFEDCIYDTSTHFHDIARSKAMAGQGPTP